VVMQPFIKEIGKVSGNKFLETILLGMNDPILRDGLTRATKFLLEGIPMALTGDWKGIAKSFVEPFLISVTESRGELSPEAKALRAVGAAVSRGDMAGLQQVVADAKQGLSATSTVTPQTLDQMAKVITDAAPAQAGLGLPTVEEIGLSEERYNAYLLRVIQDRVAMRQGRTILRPMNQRIQPPIYYETMRRLREATDDDLATAAERLGRTEDAAVLRGSWRVPVGAGILADVYKFFTGKYAGERPVEKALKEYGEKTIKGITLFRQPIRGALQQVVNWITAGTLEKEMKNKAYDKLFHLSMLIEFTDGTSLTIEKNAAIKITKGKLQYTVEAQALPVSVTKPLTFRELIYNGVKKAGAESFFVYNALTSNCQRFLADILSANGLYKAREQTFVMQDVGAVARDHPLTSKILGGITDVAAIVGGEAPSQRPTLPPVERPPPPPPMTLQELIAEYNRGLRAPAIDTLPMNVVAQIAALPAIAPRTPGINALIRGDINSIIVAANARVRRGNPQRGNGAKKAHLVSVERAGDGKHKWVATFSDGTKTSFGDVRYEDYTQHGDKKRRASYRSRHKKDLETGDPRRAGYLSYYILWGDSADFTENVAAYNRQKGGAVPSLKELAMRQATTRGPALTVTELDGLPIEIVREYTQRATRLLPPPSIVRGDFLVRYETLGIEDMRSTLPAGWEVAPGWEGNRYHRSNHVIGRPWWLSGSSDRDLITNIYLTNEQARDLFILPFRRPTTR